MVPTTGVKAMSHEAKLNALVADLAKDLESAVKAIESDKLPTTRNHYGRYLNLFVTVSHGDRATAAVVRLALLKAGANPQGVADAFHAAFGR
jgi:hypothetical protein